MIPTRLRKSVEFLTRQMCLALDDMTNFIAKKIKQEDPMKKARELIAQAFRLIDRNSKDGAHRAGLIIREQALPFFGVSDLWKIGTALC